MCIALNCQKCVVDDNFVTVLANLEHFKLDHSIRSFEHSSVSSATVRVSLFGGSIAHTQKNRKIEQKIQLKRRLACDNNYT